MVAAVIGGMGCSLIFVEGPPQPLPYRGGIRCTEHSQAPAADVVLAIAASVGAAFAAVHIWDSLVDSPRGQCNGCVFLLPIAAAISATPALIPTPFVASATAGFLRESRCRDARAELRRRGINPDDEPMPLVTPPPSSPLPSFPGTPQARSLARDGELAAARGECSVVIKVADELRAMNEPIVLDKYLHDAGVAACLR
jgi:hypothetical protein